MNDEQMLAIARSVGAAEANALVNELKAVSADNISRKIIPIYARMDKQMNASSGQVDCKDGCDFCCYYHVVVTPAEAFVLADFIAAQPAAMRTKLEGKLAATTARVTLLSEAEYVHTNIPCAFLESGSCSVYAARPTACRGHNSSNVAICKQAYDAPDTDPMIPADPERQAVSIGVRNAFPQAQQYVGYDSTQYEMHAAVTEALKHRSAFKRWKAGKVAFPAVMDRA